MLWWGTALLERFKDCDSVRVWVVCCTDWTEVQFLRESCRNWQKLCAGLAGEVFVTRNFTAVCWCTECSYVICDLP